MLKLFEMAKFQGSYKWMVFLFFVGTSFVQWVSACDPSSKELHICLNIYLERDFPLIETIMSEQKSPKYRNGRIIIEGMDLDDICKHISSLYDCYWILLPECDSLWKYDRFLRVMDVLNATQTHLCNGSKANLKELLLTSGCLIHSRSYISNCTGFDWKMSWRQVLRMQSSPSDTCSELQSYLKCLKDRMAGVTCGHQTPEVIRPYEKLLNVWLRHWCAKGLTPTEEKKYFYITKVKSEEAVKKALEELERRTELNRLSNI